MKFQMPHVSSFSTIEQSHISREKEAVSPEVIEQHSEGDKVDSTPAGVKKIEAATQVWTRSTLIVTHRSIFGVFFVNSLQQQIPSNLLAYVTSDFWQHALLSTTGVTSSLISGVVKLLLTRFMDVIGRPQSFALMVLCATIGLSMMAVYNSITPNAAAQAFYWVGFNGVGYVLGVIIADTSSLRNRGLLYAFISSTYIAPTWAGASAAQSFLNRTGWRWGYGNSSAFWSSAQLRT